MEERPKIDPSDDEKEGKNNDEEKPKEDTKESFLAKWRELFGGKQEEDERPTRGQKFKEWFRGVLFPNIVSREDSTKNDEGDEQDDLVQPKAAHQEAKEPATNESVKADNKDKLEETEQKNESQKDKESDHPEEEENEKETPEEQEDLEDEQPEKPQVEEEPAKSTPQASKRTKSREEDIIPPSIRNVSFDLDTKPNEQRSNQPEQAAPAGAEQKPDDKKPEKAPALQNFLNKRKEKNLKKRLNKHEEKIKKLESEQQENKRQKDQPSSEGVEPDHVAPKMNEQVRSESVKQTPPATGQINNEAPATQKIESDHPEQRPAQKEESPEESATPEAHAASEPLQSHQQYEEIPRATGESQADQASEYEEFEQNARHEDLEESDFEKRHEIKDTSQISSKPENDGEDGENRASVEAGPEKSREKQPEAGHTKKQQAAPADMSHISEVLKDRKDYTKQDAPTNRTSDDSQKTVPVLKPNAQYKSAISTGFVTAILIFALFMAASLI